MTYRDPIEAIRLRVRAAQQDAASRCAVFTAELRDQLPRELCDRLQQLEQEAMVEGNELDQLQGIERAVERYEEAIAEALRLAPRIEQAFNRVPDTFPERVPVNRYAFFDVYYPRYQRLRAELHEVIHQVDAEAVFQDTRDRYFDREERPLLVEATYRYLGHPLRLQICPEPSGQQNSQAMGVFPHLRFVLLTQVRPSAPPLRLAPESLSASFLKLLRLRRDIIIGHRAFDQTFVVDATPEAAERVLSTEVCSALLEIALVDSPQLGVGAGTARLEWREPNTPGQALEPAMRVLAALRQIDPVPLLAR